MHLALMFHIQRRRIRNVGSWRVKETERMKAIVAELGKLGIEVRGCLFALP